MSTNISGGVELGGLLSIEHLQEKNKNRPVKGQKLSALKDAVTLKKKSADGMSDAGEVKLLRRIEEDHPMDQESVKTKARIQAASVDTATKTTTGETAAKTATREDLYASLTKKDASDNAAYEVDGVWFSAEEMTSMREALSDVFASVKRPGGTLVYSDYAKMGIAENVVRSYAEKNLSGEQADVIAKAVSEHMDQVIAGEPEAEIVDENLYYGKRITDEQYQRAYRMILQASKEFVANSDFYSDEKKKRHAEYVDMVLNTNTHSGITLSASNTELTNSLRSGFSNLDFENEDELQTFFKQYQDWMKPAYLEVHGGSGKFVEEHLAEDIALYQKQYKDLTNRVLAASVKHVDLQI